LPPESLGALWWLWEWRWVRLWERRWVLLLAPAVRYNTRNTTGWERKLR
jgi:hypothetical protein